MIKFNFFFVDSWDNENMIVLVDDEEVLKYNHQHNDKGVVATCGSSNWRELEKSFEVRVDHIARSAKIRIQWRLD